MSRIPSDARGAAPLSVAHTTDTAIWYRTGTHAQEAEAEASLAPSARDGVADDGQPEAVEAHPLDGSLASKLQYIPMPSLVTTTEMPLPDGSLLTSVPMRASRTNNLHALVAIHDAMQTDEARRILKIIDKQERRNKAQAEEREKPAPLSSHTCVISVDAPLVLKPYRGVADIGSDADEDANAEDDTARFDAESKVDASLSPATSKAVREARRLQRRLERAQRGHHVAALIVADEAVRHGIASTPVVVDEDDLEKFQRAPDGDGWEEAEAHTSEHAANDALHTIEGASLHAGLTPTDQASSSDSDTASETAVAKDVDSDSDLRTSVPSMLKFGPSSSMPAAPVEPAPFADGIALEDWESLEELDPAGPQEEFFAPSGERVPVVAWNMMRRMHALSVSELHPSVPNPSVASSVDAFYVGTLDPARLTRTTEFVTTATATSAARGDAASEEQLRKYSKLKHTSTRIPKKKVQT